MARKPITKPVEVVEPVEAPVEPVEVFSGTITNIIKGTTLHLGDGRKLAFGESADVGDELARALRATGQAQ